jgi:hypothetical protein
MTTLTVLIEDEVDTGPLWVVRRDGHRIGEVYFDHMSYYRAAWLVRDDGYAEMIEDEVRHNNLTDAVEAVRANARTEVPV